MATSKRDAPLLPDVTREALGLSREDLARVKALLDTSSTISGAAHAALVTAAMGSTSRDPIARSNASSTEQPRQVGGISAAEPDPIDPADLTTCTCGLVVHRASMASHLDAAARGVPWSVHAANLGARGTGVE